MLNGGVFVDSGSGDVQLFHATIMGGVTVLNELVIQKYL